VDDERESPSFVLMEKLEAKGAEVSFHDPFVPAIRPSREHPKLTGKKSVPIDSAADIVVIATAHAPFKDHDFSKLKIPLVDTRNCVAPRNRPNLYFQA
jgi:UDP-N-acetyl-D-glucosamine dehydrogenase